MSASATYLTWFLSTFVHLFFQGCGKGENISWRNSDSSFMRACFHLLIFFFCPFQHLCNDAVWSQCCSRTVGVMWLCWLGGGFKAYTQYISICCRETTKIFTSVIEMRQSLSVALYQRDVSENVQLEDSSVSQIKHPSINQLDIKHYSGTGLLWRIMQHVEFTIKWISLVQPWLLNPFCCYWNNRWC